MTGFRAASTGNRLGSSAADLRSGQKTFPGGQPEQTAEEEPAPAVQERGEESERSTGGRVPAQDQERVQLTVHQHPNLSKQR